MDEEKKLAIYIFIIYISMTGLNLWNDSNKKLPKDLIATNKKSLERFFVYFSYEGNWEINNKKIKNKNIENLLEDEKNLILENKKGLLDMNLEYRINLLTKYTTPNILLYMKFYDPRFSDGKMIKIKQHLEIKNINGEIILENIKKDRTLPNNYYIYQDSKLINRKTCDFIFQMKLNKNLIEKNNIIKTSKFFNNSEIFKYSIKTNKFDFDCNLNFKGNLKIIPVMKKNLKEMIYNFFIISVIIFSFYGSLKTIKKLGTDIGRVKKISLSCIEIICCQDSFILFFNLQIGTIIHNTFNFFFIFFFYFLLFCFIDQRILSFIWQNQIVLQNPQLTQREIQKKSYIYQIKIIFIIIIYNYIMFRFLLNPYLIIINSLILLPQIYHNMKTRAISFFDKEFIIFYTSSSYIFFFYFRAIPNNIIKLKPYYKESLIGLLIILLSIALLYLQDIYGSKFLIPKFLKKQYNYFLTLKKYKKKINLNTTKKNNKLMDSITMNSTITDNSSHSILSSDVSVNTDTCTICLDDLENEIQENDIKNKNFKRIIKKIRKGVVMCPPCNHGFHPACLLQWMEIKMECPYCKLSLPQID